MRLPTIHLNGTSAKMLIEGYSDAWDAVRAAEKAICAVEFNARDYYPAGPDAWEQARSERDARLKQLNGIADELETIIGHIQDAEDARTARRRSAA